LAGRVGGRIELSMERHAKTVTVRCRDNGPGVPPAIGEKIFDYGVSTRPGSRGYGLARSREVVGHFGGTLILEESMRGAVFALTLEAVDGP